MATVFQNDAKNETRIVGTTVVINDPDMRLALDKAVGGKVVVHSDDHSVDIRIDKKRAESLVEELFKGADAGLVAKYNPRDKKYSLSLNVVGATFRGVGRTRIKVEFNKALDSIYSRL
ncbi:MAG: hypothetical protein IKQ72_07090 [Bacteroidaceae bacterium]|nr:hypothetical protein [Bacteroidaceae bacterium]